MQRISAGAVVVAVGGIALFVSLFFTWYEDPFGENGVSAWTAFELLDIVIAGLALGSIAAAAPVDEAGRTVVPGRALPWLGAASLILVLVTLVHDPPSVNPNASLAEGAWIALVGGVLVALGAALSGVRVSLVIGAQPEERPGEGEPSGDEPTRPLDTSATEPRPTDPD